MLRSHSGSSRSQFLNCWLLITCLSLLPADSLLGVSQLNFPRLSFDAITGIAIVNPTDTTAQVTMTIYGSDGLPASAAGLNNPVTVEVKAGQQFSKVVEEIFGAVLAPERVAWIRATSPVDSLTGFFLVLNISPTTFFDGADLPKLSDRIVFSEVCLRADCSTELNLINPGNSPRTVDVELIGLDQPISTKLMIPSLGTARIDAADLLDGVQVSGQVQPDSVYIVASSDGALAGFEFVRLENGDLLGLNAKPASELLNTLFFPQLAVLAPFQTQVTVMNLGDEQALVTFRAFKPNGESYGIADLSNNPVTRNLNPGQRLSEDVETLFGFRGNTTLSGWVLVESTSVSINGTLTYAIPAINSVAAVASQAVGSTSAVFSHIATTAGFFTGIAALNPGTLPANVRVVALRPNGTILGSFTTIVEPRQRIAVLIDEIIPAARGQAGGFIIIRANIPVLLTSLFGSLSSGVLANVPPQPIPDLFRPDSSIPQLRLNPPLAVVPPGQGQPFQIQGLAGMVNWTVNGVAGGNPFNGTIDAAGNYTAPAQVPISLPITIAGEVAGQRAAASVDVLSVQSLFQNQGVVQSIAYLEGLRKLYTAEISLSGFGPAQGQAGVGSRILNVGAEGQQVVLELPDEDVRHMISFQGINGREYLLLAGNTSGQILRLEPIGGSLVPVATGITGPSALALDPLAGDLFVAAQNQVLSVSRANLNTGLTSAALLKPLPRPLDPPRGIAFAGDNLVGIAVNPCTGNIAVADEELGQIIDIDRLTGMPTPLDNIAAGHLLYALRIGVSCPQGAQLLGVDPGGGRVFLRNSDGVLVNWAMVRSPSSLTSLPQGSPFDNQDGFTITQSIPNSEILLVETPGIYSPRTPVINPPFIPPIEPGSIVFRYTASVLSADPSLGLAFGAEVSGRFFYDPSLAEVSVVNPNQLVYELSGQSGIEISFGGTTYSSVALGTLPISAILSVIDNLPGDIAVDQFSIFDEVAAVSIVDTDGTLLDSLAIPEMIHFNPDIATGIVVFTTVIQGEEIAVSVLMTSLARIS